jgi:hypothetical protein
MAVSQAVAVEARPLPKKKAPILRAPAPPKVRKPVEEPDPRIGAYNRGAVMQVKMKDFLTFEKASDGPGAGLNLFIRAEGHLD